MKQFRKRMIALGLSVSICIGSVSSLKVFATSDIPDDYFAKTQIEEFISRGILNGYPDKTYRPNSVITRAEFVKIVNQTFGFNEVGTETFKDIKEGAWYTNDIKIAVKKGYINGYEDNTFKPNNEITREEMAKILGVVLNIIGDGKTNFVDDSEISPWAKKYVDGLADKKIISGYPNQTFKPKSGTTRGESIAVISRSENFVNEDKKPDDDYILPNINNKPQAPQNPEEKPQQEMWTMVWNDEFSGTKLDETKWTYDLGNWIVDENGNGVDAGWGNNELQNYTKDNIEVENGNLVITAKNEKTSDNLGEYNYTSSRIKTKGLFAQKYGRFEARMALPADEGLWPAFWLLPENDVYGGWAASGEIDIMEARGRLPQEVEGTLHYGGKWPENKYSGKSYEFEDGSDITQFHEYAIEWEPGEIRWYVDGKLYQTQNNWYANDVNSQEKYSFPAPFDQEFHILLNLAVGGWFDNGITPSKDFEEAKMLVDYVRVYELTGRDYMTPKEPVIEKESIPENIKKPINGNYIYDTRFEKGFSKELSSDTWALLTDQFGGEAQAIVDDINGINYAKIDVINGGKENYSTQLIQYVPIVKGHTYKISYNAKSNSNRNMALKVCGGENRGWSVYSDNYNVDLSNEIKRYEHTFTMNEDTDVNARLEFNMGLDTNDVWIGNIIVEEIEPVIDYDAPKSPLKNGNHIYNGTFDKGNIDRKTYWNLESNDGVEAKYSVNEKERNLLITLNGESEKSQDVRLSQKGILLSKKGEYELTFDAKTDSLEGKEIEVIIKNDDNDIISKQKIELTSNMKKNTVLFDIPQGKETNNGTIELWIGGNNKNIYLDNVLLKNNAKPDLSDKITAPLKNGDFSQNLDNWQQWSILEEFKVICTDEKAIIEIPEFWKDGDGSEVWAAQFKQANLPIYKDLEYTVSFDVSSTIERELELVIQNSGYQRYFEKKVNVGTQKNTYTYTFIPTKDDIVELNFLLGKYDDYQKHQITIDNIVLEVK